MSSPDATHLFDRWWNASGEWVEPPNQRRNGESGVVFIMVGDRGYYAKRQSGHLHRSFKHPLGRPTALREAESIAALRSLGVPVPRLAYFGARKLPGGWQALLVTEALHGMMPLDVWYAEHAGRTSPKARVLMLEHIGQALAKMHRAGWQHCCLYAKHVFVRVIDDGPTPQVEIALIDLEKCRKRWFPRWAARHDLEQFSRHRGEMSADDWECLVKAHTAAF